MTDIAFAGVDQKRLAVASQWQLMWWAFRRHRLAMAGLIITIFLYIIAIAPGFFAINDPNQQNGRAAYHPPQALHIIDTNPDGSWSFGLYFQALPASPRPADAGCDLHRGPEPQDPDQALRRGLPV